MHTTVPPLVLASGSPRRRQLLADAGYRFEVQPTDVAEDFDPALPPVQVPQVLAERKAHAAAARHPDRWVLAADTVVVLDGQILNKPADELEAFGMLAQLSGRSHVVHTGVCLGQRLPEGGHRFHTLVDSTTVHFRHLPEAAIDYYVAEYRPLDKAGAYGVQDWLGLRYVARIEGCFYNVMGLPVPRLAALLDTLSGTQ